MKSGSIMSHGGFADSKSSAAPIQPIQFLKSLLKIWRPPVSSNGLSGPLKLGEHANRLEILVHPG